MAHTCLAAVLAACLLAGMAAAADWHVGPLGKPENKGTQDSPWDLKSAMAGEQKAIQPGDTVWLGMGTYMIAPPTARGWDRAFHAKASGAEGKPIIFRAAPGERVTIDGAIWVECHDTWFWGLEVMTSTPHAAEPGEANRPEGGFNTSDGARCKFINCIVHDNNQGFSWWVEAVDSEVYGCLIYHNGVRGTDRGHGHGIYTQNKDGTKRIVDNILWNGHYYGLQAYGSERAYVYGFHVEGNFLFSNGMAATPDGCTNAVIGGGRPSQRIAFLSNVSYMHPTSNRVNASLYYTRAPNQDLICRDNYFANGRYALVLGCWEKIVGSGNTLFARSQLAMVPLEKADPQRKGQYDWDNNEYVLGTWPRPFELGWTMYEGAMSFKEWQDATGLDKNSKAVESSWHAPKGVKVFIRPNQYEPGRAHVAVLNWDRATAVALDLKGILKEGQPYRVFNVQKLWDDPVAQGIYDGKPIAVPTLLSWLAPEFDAFLVLPSAHGDGR